MYNWIEKLLDGQVIILTTVTILLSAWYLQRKWRHRNRKVPPGLPSLPIIGSLPWLAHGATHLTFTQFAKKYGNVYTINFGQEHAVVLNDYTSVHEALINQSVIFADRPTYYISQEFNPEQKGLIIPHYNETFVRNKQVSLTILRDMGFGKRSMEEKILYEITDLLETFQTQDAKPFDPSGLLYVSVSNIISLFLFRKSFAYNDTRFIRVLETLRYVVKQYGELMLIQYLPFVLYFPWAKRGLQALNENARVVRQFVEEEMRERAQACGLDDHQGDFISAYKHKMADCLDPDSLVDIAVDLLAAGTDTTSTTLRWALIYMVNNPDIQARVQGKIDDVIGQGRPPSMSDQASLAIVEATILETLRKSSIIAMDIPHRLSAPTELQGFFLEEGTVVYINLWSIHHDSDVWPDPERFDPERFLDDQGLVTNKEKIIPFGLGRRSCLGEALARQELFLYFTSILQRFKVLPPPGKDKLPEEGVFGATLAPKPHHVILKLR